MPVVALVHRGECGWCRCGKAAWITGRWRGSCWQWRGRWRQRRMRPWSQRSVRRLPQVLESARGTSLAPVMGRLPLVMMRRLHGLVLIAASVLVVSPRWGAVLRM